MSKKLKIACVSSELTPFFKTGGLANVACSLPLALRKLGEEIILIVPLYARLIDKDKNGLELIFKNVKLTVGGSETINVNYWRGKLNGIIPVYFIENAKYFSRNKELYGSQHENARFFIFDVAALKLLSLLKFAADIIHCHDWHTGLIPYLLKTDFKSSLTLKNTRTVYTIHNLSFQMGRNWWEVPPSKKDDGRSPLPGPFDRGIEYVNFAKRAILNADLITTVSETYREEIMTNEFGEDLQVILHNRRDRLFGIVNGIDENAWNPNNDPGLYRNYGSNNFYLKTENKKAFQKKFGLTIDGGAPMICGTSRMTFQKGFELIVEVVPFLLDLDLQIVLAGQCDKKFLATLKQMAKQHPKKMVFLPRHEDCVLYETFSYAASDLFLMPSQFEPCGLNQLIAMRYGCVPVVHRVGGLKDTVADYVPENGKGTGFVFDKFDNFALYGAIIRAIENWRHHDDWNKLTQKVMRESHDWDIPAKKYIRLYRKIIKL
jgi:starch synthase